MPPPISTSGVHRAQYVPFNAAKVVKGIPLANIRNEKQNPFRCGMSSVSDANHRDALGVAMSKAQDVMTRASGLTVDQQACIQKTVAWLSSAGAGGIGNIVLQRITALGASHAAVVDLLKDTPRDNDLRTLQTQVTKMIVDLGIAIGDCRTPPQGAALSNREKAVSRLNDKADLCVKSCVSSMGGQKLMEAIGRAILPQPIMNALVDKRPDLAAKISANGAGSIDLSELLNAKALHDIQNVVNVELDTADPQAAVTAIIELLKIPALVVEGDPGKEVAQTNKEKGVSDLPPGVRELAANGKNVAVNYNDFGKMGNKSTVDGANAARLAELDVEKHRITIDGMLAAFKLGLEGNRACGHLITGIHNLGGNVSTFAHDPVQATTTGSIEIQTDPVEDNQQKDRFPQHEMHHGSGTLLNAVEERLDTFPPEPVPATASLDPGAHTLGKGDFPVFSDGVVKNIEVPDPWSRFTSQADDVRSPDVDVLDGDDSSVGNDDNLSKRFDTLEQRFQALRLSGLDNADVREQIVNEVPHQSLSPMTYVVETRISSEKLLGAGDDQSPPLANVQEDGARVRNENTSWLDDDATSISSMRLDDASRMRPENAKTTGDEGKPNDAAAKLLQPINVVHEFKGYLDAVSVHPVLRRGLEQPPRVVLGHEEVVNALGRKELKPVLQDASRFALNFGAQVSPSDLVRFQMERSIIKSEPRRGTHHSVTPPKAEYLEFKRVINARDQAIAAGLRPGGLNIKNELRRINAELGQQIAGQKTEGRVFEHAAKWAGAASEQVVPDFHAAEGRGQVKAPQDKMLAVGQWVQSQPQQLDPLELDGSVPPLSPPVPRAPEQHASIRDMLNNMLTAREQRNSSRVGPFKGDPAPSVKAAALHNPAGAHVGKVATFDPLLNSRGSSAAPSEVDSDDSSVWDQGTPDELMDARSVLLDQTPRLVPNPQPLQKKPTTVVNERDSMLIFRSGLTPEQNQRMMQ